MNRRSLLATVGAGVAGLAGCSGAIEEFAPTEDGETATPTAEQPGDPDGMAPCRDSGWGYQLDGPPVRDLPRPSRSFDDYDCPAFDWTTRTVCYHTATLSEEGVVLVPTEESVFITDGGSLGGRFVLVNRTGELIRTHPGSWSVLEPTNDGWTFVDGGDPDCERRIEHRETHWWHLDAGDPEEINVTGVSLDVGPGVYALAAPAFLPDGDDVMCAAVFEAEKIELDPMTPIPRENASLTGA